MIKKKEKIRREIGTFLKQYERKAHPNWNPNDRKYDRKIEKQIKKMDPAELSECISGDQSEITEENESLWFDLKPVAGVNFLFNDSVEIIKGQYAGKTGVVVSLIALTPEPRYLVEPEGDTTFDVLESQLKNI